MPFQSFPSMNVAIRCRNGSKIKRLLLALGIVGENFDNQLRQDWHIIITDQELFETIPSKYLRIVLSDRPLRSSNGQVIRIPQTLDLTMLYFALVNAAKTLGLQHAPAY
ncbi:hypothetical protein [Candidatus Odyssella acanthamoebae]|nr:hypothetical protein [Candidatus Paracaedibacter acanthamoebae]